ncbi:MAG TPA: MFS transporter, partial [Bacillota bacterium]|nr:MFS transporter [Bacillota bacterium]
ATPGILVPILLLGIVNIFAMNFHVLVPLFAKNVFHGGADTFGVLMSANGVGALLGAVIQAGRSASGPKAHTLVMAAVGICTFELLLVPVRIFALAFGLLALVGLCVILFSTTTNSLVQVQTPDHLRGRVMSLYTMVFAGLTPVGSLIAGTTANLWGAPAAMAFGAVISLLGLVFLVSRFPHVLKHKE